MFSVLENARRRGRTGFSLMELLVLIVALAVLAAIVLPKFVNSSRRCKEADLRSSLNLVRNAVSVFQADTGLYPKTLADLTNTKAPTLATAKGLDGSGTEISYSPVDWHGPYLQELSNDPVSGNPFAYSTKSPTVGKVSSSATGNALDGVAFSNL